VLHIATVHFGSPRWIEVQTRYLREHISVPYMTWTSLNEIDPSYGSYFDRVIHQSGRHSDKLNHLAIEIAHEATDEDLLMFLDGDAFPIADPMPLISDGLARAPLIAVRRAENNRDRQPHPCFCVTTVGAWQGIPGDWSMGYNWPTGNDVAISDVGGNLLRRLELTETPWVEVLRSNRKNPDPIFFAIYGDAIYHHGAGFRPVAFLRGHRALLGATPPAPRLPIVRPLARWAYRGKRLLTRYKHERRNAELSKRVFEAIQRGDTEWLNDFL
jgi:hypothetical protein